MHMDIPLARPCTDEREVSAVAEVIKSGWVSQGKKVEEFEHAVAEYVGARFAVATNSCTSALHLCLLLQGIGPGDEVICPSFTCMATANTIRHVGAMPVFAEVNPRTFNLDPADAQHHLTKKTKAIMVVHQIGLAADIDGIAALAKREGLKVVEDAATALGAERLGTRVGALGHPTAFSFHPRKIITTGEGGMITTDDPSFVERARMLRSHGASVSDLVRHEARGAIYASYPEAGYNYRMTDLQGAMGAVQAQKLPDILGRKHDVAAHYDRALQSIEGVSPPYVPPGYLHSYQSYLVTLPEGTDRDGLLRAMSDRGISCRHGIAPMHFEPYYRELFGNVHLPVTESISARTMFLPIYPQMTPAETDFVVESLAALLPRHLRATRRP